MSTIRNDPSLQELLEHVRYLQHKATSPPSNAGWDRVMLKQLVEHARIHSRAACPMIFPRRT